MELAEIPADLISPLCKALIACLAGAAVFFEARAKLIERELKRGRRR